MKYKKSFVFIMAGGVGSRFWPASHSGLPKQFHRLVREDQSMIQATFERFKNLVPVSNIFVITSADYVALTAEHLPELEAHQIIAEPCMRNTAPATLLGTMVAHHFDAESSLIFSPADHVIDDVSGFEHRLGQGIEFLKNNEGIVTMGIKPTEPHTGYGYIHFLDSGAEPYEVVRFKEKPTRDVAEQYLMSGDYLWNSGIFMWRSSYYLDLFSKLAPEMYRALGEVYIDRGGRISQRDLENVYPDLENISVDYLIMERAPKVYTLPGDFGWSDIGNWRALYEYLRDCSGSNVIQAAGHVIRQSSNCLIRSEGKKLVVVKGLDNYCIVDSDKALLIYPLNDDQEVKEIREEVKRRYGDEYV